MKHNYLKLFVSYKLYLLAGIVSLILAPIAEQSAGLSVTVKLSKVAFTLIFISICILLVTEILSAHPSIKKMSTKIQMVIWNYLKSIINYLSS